MSEKESGLPVRVVEDDTILIIGGGPVGLMTASVLAHFKVKSMILERNTEPTKWPKMDLTNARSMELLHKIGLADDLRSRGVPSSIPYTVLMSTGLSQKTTVTRWDLPSVDEYREKIKSTNDGTQPLQPYLRVSQNIFENWMRDLCQENPLTDLQYHCKLESIKETVDGVEAIVTKGEGGGSEIYRASPFSFLLIHFRSRDLERLHRQGRFWHLFMLKSQAFGGAVISQDEKEIFTVHFPLPPGTDAATIESHDAIYTVLGGMYEPFKIKIDEILVRSTFRPSIAVANSFAGPNLRLFLAGDSAHQNIPTGGYGMNTGLGDAFDIAWKLAAVVNGYGGKGLLESYEQERKPTAAQNMQRSGVHMGVHMTAVDILTKDPEKVDSDSQQGAEVRGEIHGHYSKHDGENTDLGIEMGYRYKSPICMVDDSETEPPWDPHTYLPTTWPGSRAPHVLLSDQSSILDHLGRDFSLVDFTNDRRPDIGGSLIVQVAQEVGVPLTYIQLVNEKNAENIWERPLVVVRPDGHVAWRGDSIKDKAQARQILGTIIGR
ncbi:FAD binding domain-containing [Fusarium albosuccineum]|uniref:FAD binding domain-containing n=1 Tax=Fusarium albosuccineum TaxID=1237068 RepID=A0A8H4PJU3_9HYPO|nr:FAD binding domain-containing [Fusarium albosuccineum]